MKKFLYPLLAVALVGAGALYWVTDNLGEIAASAITQYGSAMTKARVGVEHVEIHPSTGKGVISGLLVGNPPGFKTAHAVRVETVELDIDMTTVGSDVVVVRMLLVNKPDVIYEKGDRHTNFDAIRQNIDAYLGPDKKKAPRGKTRIVVEELTIANATARASAPFLDGKTVSIALPDISLRDIGKNKGGVTPGELGQEIANAMTSKLSPAANFDRMKRSAGEALDKAGTAIKGLFN